MGPGGREEVWRGSVSQVGREAWAEAGWEPWGVSGVPCLGRTRSGGMDRSPRKGLLPLGETILNTPGPSRPPRDLRDWPAQGLCQLPWEKRPSSPPQEATRPAW